MIILLSHRRIHRFLLAFLFIAVAQSHASESPKAEPSTTNQTVGTDPIIWLMEHKQLQPREVQLLKKTSVPIIVDGKSIGFVTKPAGSMIHLDEFSRFDVKSSINGINLAVPLENTDLTELAKKQIEIFTQNAHQQAVLQADNDRIVNMIKEKLSKTPIATNELLDLYVKYPIQLVPMLEHQNINLTGQVTRILLSGMDGLRATITLSENLPDKITIFCDLDSPYRIVRIKERPGYKNKFDLMNGQLLFTSYKGETFDYHQGRHYTTKPYGNYLVHHENAESDTILVCTERSNINSIWVRLKTSNGHNLVFEATSPIQ